METNSAKILFCSLHIILAISEFCIRTIASHCCRFYYTRKTQGIFSASYFFVSVFLFYLSQVSVIFFNGGKRRGLKIGFWAWRNPSFSFYHQAKNFVYFISWTSRKKKREGEREREREEGVRKKDENDSRMSSCHHFKVK